jgi:hypothetical protein
VTNLKDGKSLVQGSDNKKQRFEKFTIERVMKADD